MNVYLKDCLLQAGADEIPDTGWLITDKEESALQKKLNAIAPVSVYEADGMVLLSCFGSFRSAAEAYLLRYREDLFSQEALDFLHGSIRKPLLAEGYRPSAFPHQYGLAFLCDRADCVPESLLLPGVRRLTEADRNLSVRVTMKLADCIRRPSFGMVQNGELVAVAAVNSCGGSIGLMEIGVECAPAFRRRGYAKACTAALARELCQSGHTALYRCYHTNTASRRTAEAAGFSPCGRFFTYTAFRK